MKTFFLAIVMVISLASCTAMYGFKSNKYLTEDQIIAQAINYNIPVADNYTLDTSFYRYLSKLKDTSLAMARNNHAQPLQVLYFQKNENTFTLQSYHANCYTGGFPNLKWNRNNVFSTFIPGQQAPLDEVLTLKQQFDFLRPLKGVVAFNSINYDYIVFVYWSRFMGRQSKRLIELVQTNAALEKTKKVKIIYVNNDNFFLSIGK